MSMDFPHDLKTLADRRNAASSAAGDAPCDGCVTFVAGPPPSRESPSALPWLDASPGTAAAADDAPQPDADSPLAYLFGPDVSASIEWASAADPGPPPPADDEEATFAYARGFAAARFARRVLEGDPAAWLEALASYRERFRLPGQVRSTVRVEDDGSLRVAIELPLPDDIPPRRGETRTERRARYDDHCSATLLAFACDVFRVLPPTANTAYVVGYRHEADPATGRPRYAILMRLATDRDSLELVDLSRATPSAAFEYLGGAAKKFRGELVPLACETDFAHVM